jgi:hypothetical protein
MRISQAILVVFPLLALATPARAERMLFDHHLDARIGAVLDSGRKEMIRYDSSNPAYVFDRIAIEGTSAENWTEALEIIVRTPGKAVRSPGDWVRQISAPAAAACPAEVTPLAEDATSWTVMRRSPACAGNPAETALYRVVAGRKSLFLLGARYKGAMPPETHARWLSILASARISG